MADQQNQDRGSDRNAERSAGNESEDQRIGKRGGGEDYETARDTNQRRTTDRGTDVGTSEPGMPPRGGGAAGSGTEAMEAEARHDQEVRDDAEARKDLEAPRSPEQVEAEMGSHPDRSELKARQQRDREEMGRPSMDTESQDMQDDVVERRKREAEENELR